MTNPLKTKISSACWVLTLLAVLSITAPALPAFAQDNEAETAAIVIAPKDVRAYENHGLAPTDLPLDFGSSLLDGSKRSALTALLKYMRVTSTNPLVQDMIKATLMGRYSVDKIDNDIDITAGEDLLTLRLNALLRGGYYDQAFALYSGLDKEPYNQALARAGVLSMLYAGQKSLACLEIKTLGTDYAGKSFWDDLNAYCRASLVKNDEKHIREEETEETEKESEEEEPVNPLAESKRSLLHKLATDEDFRLPYSAKDFAALSPLEQALVAAEQKLDVSAVTPALVKEYPAPHIQLLLRQNSLSDENKMALMQRGHALGLIETSALEIFYKDLKDTAGDWAAPARLYQRLESAFADAGENASSIEETLSDVLQASKSDHASYLPLLRFFANVPWKDATISDASALATLYLTAGQTFPFEWAQLILDALPKADPESNEKTDISNLTEEFWPLAPYTYINIPGFRRTDALKSQILYLFEQLSFDSGYLGKKVIENIDKSGANVDNAARVYENSNLTRLTYDTGYVMPSLALLDAINYSAREKRTGETVLLCIHLLAGPDLGTLYPGTTAQVIEELNRVGLNEISSRLAAAAVMTMREDN